MIARKTFAEIRVMAVVYLLLLEILLVPVVLLWPDLYDDLQRSSLIRNLGSFADFAKRIGEGITDSNEDAAYRNWMAVQLFFKGVNLVGLAAAVLLGTALFARERESQTLEFLLARPVTRGRILWQKSWPTALCVVVPVFVANWTAIPWSRSIELDLPFCPLTTCCIHSAMFVLMMLAATTWVSILCRVQSHVAFWVGGVTILNIGFYLIPRLRRFSMFHLSDYDVYGPTLAGNIHLYQLIDPTAHGAAFWVAAATLVFYLLAWRSLRRLEL